MARDQKIYETNNYGGGVLVDRTTELPVGFTAQGVDQYMVIPVADPLTGRIGFSFDTGTPKLFWDDAGKKLWANELDYDMGDGVTMLRLNTTDSDTYGPFTMSAMSFDVNADGQPNHVVAWGWNIGPNGAPLVAGQPAARMAIESHWQRDPGGTNIPVMEIHPVSYYGTDGMERRPIDFSYDISGPFINQSTGSFSTRRLTFADDTNTNVYLQIVSAGQTVNAGANVLLNNTVWKQATNNLQWLKQYNAAGNALLPLPYIDSSNRLVLSGVAYFPNTAIFTGLVTGMQFGGDVVFNANNAIFGSSHGTRVADGSVSFKSAGKVVWSSTIYGYDAPDTGVSRVSAGVVGIGTGAAGSVNAALQALSYKSAAPSGGTAAVWKLGVAATVSPTAPNRTLEVEIGGTTYYVHAKTTNN